MDEFARPAIPSCPYVGLMPFAEEDTEFFFGRDRETELIAANLFASRLTLLYGNSGVGKSSVLNAGVMPHLDRLASENRADPDTPGFAAVLFNNWRDDPLPLLADHIRATLAAQFGMEAAEAADVECSLVDKLFAWSRATNCQLLIVLDQFEEYFLYHPRDMDSQSFGAELARAVNHPDLRVSFLISLREDGLAKLDRFKGYIPNLFDNYLRVDHLDSNAAREAIEKPLLQYNQMLADKEVGVSIEEQLIDDVIDQIRIGKLSIGETGAGVVEPAQASESDRVETPFLQLVMMRLWQTEMRLGSKLLRAETLHRLGGAARIVRTHLDQVMTTLSRDEQDSAAKFFHFLVTPSGTKIAHTATDIADYSGETMAATIALLDKLSGGEIRVLKPVAPPLNQKHVNRYEIFHDVLAPAILDWRSRFVQRQSRSSTSREAGILGILALLLSMIACAGIPLGALIMLVLLLSRRPLLSSRAMNLPILSWLLSWVISSALMLLAMGIGVAVISSIGQFEKQVEGVVALVFFFLWLAVPALVGPFCFTLLYWQVRRSESRGTTPLLSDRGGVQTKALMAALVFGYCTSLLFLGLPIAALPTIFAISRIDRLIRWRDYLVIAVGWIFAWAIGTIFGSLMGFATVEFYRGFIGSYAGTGSEQSVGNLFKIGLWGYALLAGLGGGLLGPFVGALFYLSASRIPEDRSEVHRAQSEPSSASESARQPSRPGLIVAMIVLFGFGSIFIFCGGMAGFFFVGSEMIRKEVEEDLKSNPVLVEHIGEIVSFERKNLLSGNDVYSYDVKGKKEGESGIVETSGIVDAKSVTGDDLKEKVTWGKLILPSGEEYDLFPAEPAQPSDGGEVPEPDS